MARHPYKQDPKRDLNLENYPYGYMKGSGFRVQGIQGFRVPGLFVLGIVDLCSFNYESSEVEQGVSGGDIQQRSYSAFLRTPKEWY